jgi:hypothetical protein
MNVPFDLYYTGLIGNIIMFSVAFMVAVFLMDQKKNLKNLTIWDMD